MRIRNHPIFGDLREDKKVNFKFNDNAFIGREGDTIASALIANGIKVFRHSDKKREPRSVFCGIGKCNDCLVKVNGTLNVKACNTKLKEGMVIWSE
jgi:sarcosine oxidase, subunit alpha